MARLRASNWLLALLFAVAGGWTAPSPAANAPAAPQELLTRPIGAVVGVQVTAAEGARSAETLGRERSGSGVVIGADGLILTIGYLMLEADSIQVTTHDNRTVPARAGGLRPGHRLRPAAAAAAAARHRAGAPGHAAGQASTGDAADGGGRRRGPGVAMTQLVSRRAFSGYWEYHIEGALFTSPPLGNHSGAPFFNQRGELLGIGSLFVGDAMGDNRRMPGNMFVPVDLLKPILAEMQQTGSTRVSRRPWLGLSSTEQGGRVQIVRVSARTARRRRRAWRPATSCWRSTATRVSTLEGFYKKLWARRARTARCS
jgi:serine protease Do